MSEIANERNGKLVVCIFFETIETFLLAKQFNNVDFPELVGPDKAM